MKLSYAISLQPTVFKAVAVGDWEEQIEFLAELGYDGVELAIRDPAMVDIRRLDEILSRHNIVLSAIGTGQAFLEDGLSLSDSDLVVRNSAVLRIKDHLELARAFGTQVIIGLMRGNNKEGIDEKSLSCLTDSCKKICEYAAKENIIIAIEPINRYETCFFNTVDETIEFIDHIGYEELRILLDTFHMNIEERDIYESIKECQHLLSHIHIADSNRRYPGEGHLDFQRIINTLKRISYHGFLSGEMLALPDLETAMTKYRKKMEEILSGQI